MKTIARHILATIKDDIKKMPVVVLFGPRQVGKTTIAKQIFESDVGNHIYLDLELPSDRARIANAELFFNSTEKQTVILDEVQVVPDLFPVIRSVVDKNRRAGRFLLLGSASPELIQRSSESLAGRVRFREVFPFSFEEVSSFADKIKLWFRGGFPEAFLADSDANAMEWQIDFMRSYITRDLPQLGLSMPAFRLELLLSQLAHLHGKIINYSQVARALGVSQPTVTDAVHFLEQALLIRLVKPWHTNGGKRLVRSPKIYFRDSGMLHNLLGIENFQQLLGHPQAGNSWEGFIIQQIISELPRNMQTFFYRTSNGAELDLIIVKSNKILYGIEIKLNTAPSLSKGNTEAALDLMPAHKVLVAPVDSGYPYRNDWQVCSLPEIIQKIHSGKND